MNELASLGLILLLSLLAGHLVKYVRIPEVTGYILAGVVVGPSLLGWINEQNLAALGIFSEVALGLILFSIGSIFEFDRFRKVGRSILRIEFTESLLVAVLVWFGMMLLGQPWHISLLLGVIAMETAAASTLMVLRESNASGPMSETILGIIAVNNVLCLTCFSIVIFVLELAGKIGGAEAGIGGFALRSLFMLVWQIFGSIALGYLVGLLLATWGTRVVEHGETLILLIGCVLLTVGAALALELSTLVASLAVGATMANFSRNSEKLLLVQSKTDPPFYAIFFVIAGANLHVSLLKSLGMLGLVYVVARAAGKLIGARLGSRGSALPLNSQKMLGMGLMSHAGLAIGLVLVLSRRFPEAGTAISTVVLAAILIYELVGPVSVRFAIERAGEVGAPADDSMDLLQ